MTSESGDKDEVMNHQVKKLKLGKIVRTKSSKIKLTISEGTKAKSLIKSNSLAVVF